VEKHQAEAEGEAGGEERGRGDPGMAPRAQQNPGRRRSSGAKFFYCFVPGLILMLFINIRLHAEHYGRRGKDNTHVVRTGHGDDFDRDLEIGADRNRSPVHTNTSQPAHRHWEAGEESAVPGEAGGGKLEPIPRGKGRDWDTMRGSGEEGNSSTATSAGAGVAYHLLFMMYPEMPVRALCTVESLVHSLKDDVGSAINMWVDNGKSPAPLSPRPILLPLLGVHRRMLACFRPQASTQH
jgi:hypothetical protein